jgi:hypothetical protein
MGGSRLQAHVEFLPSPQSLEEASNFKVLAFRLDKHRVSRLQRTCVRL